MEHFRISDVRSNRYGFQALGILAEKAKNLKFQKVIFDFSSCIFFEANMVAPFYAVLTRYYKGLNQVSLININSEVEAILRKNDFLTEFGFSELEDSYDTTLPFKKFKLNADSHFLAYLEQYLKGHGIPMMSPNLQKKFRNSLFEIFKNAAEHSKSMSGLFVCGQSFPRKRLLNFTIADAGIGIPANVRGHLHKEMSACEALQWALTEGNSTRDARHPGAMGLKLLKEFIKHNQGKIKIISETAFYELAGTSELYEEMNGEFPGTCVSIEIKTDDNTNYCLSSDLKPSDIF